MVVAGAPLRISFLGGGADFEDFYAANSGAVTSIAINKCTYVIAKERFDNMICSKKEIVDKIDSLEYELVREAMRMTGVDKGVEITTLA